jgi:phospholipid transport system substrate-binding protein
MLRSRSRSRSSLGPRAAALALAAALAFAGAERVSAAASDGTVDARAFVQQTIDSVLVILRNKSIPLETKKTDVESIAYQSFDFTLMSRLVLARNWEKFSPKQQTDFVDAFKKHLSATYRDTLNTFRDENIAIVGSRTESNGDVTVMTVVKGSADDTKVDYRMRKGSSGWRGIDVIIEGVSLVQNFRSQAQEIVSSEGPDGLIQKLRSKQMKKPAKNA